jgi:hypothetical protein
VPQEPGECCQAPAFQALKNQSRKSVPSIINAALDTPSALKAMPADKPILLQQHGISKKDQHPRASLFFMR